MKKRFSKVIIAKHLFDGINEKDYEGYLCLSGNHIVEKKAGKPEKDILDQAQEVLNFRDELVMPGITDTHTFFTGYAIYHVGAGGSITGAWMESGDVGQAERRRNAGREISK